MVEEENLDLAKEIVKNAKKKGVTLYLPPDSVVADAFSNDAKTDTAPTGCIPSGWSGLDIGEDSCHLFGEVIKKSRTII